jgi:hypothetical protein
MPAMIETIWNWAASHEWLMGGLTLASLAMFVGSLLALPFLVARLPADYFADPRRHTSRLRRLHPLVYLAALVLKNLLGWVLVLAGIVMLVLPGQGLITILIGLVLSDFPGKFALERRLACTPAIFNALNWLRRRAGHAPLQAPLDQDGRPCGD